MSYGHVGRMVGRLHVSATPLEVIRYVRSRMTDEARTAPEWRDFRRSIYRTALAAHAENRALYQRVMGFRA